MGMQSHLIFSRARCYHDHMTTPEQSSFADMATNQAEEVLDPRHFYAAYTFEYATLRGHDVAVLLDKAHQFECPVRYWWASETTNLTGAFDRQICLLDRLAVEWDDKTPKADRLLKKSSCRLRGSCYRWLAEELIG